MRRLGSAVRRHHVNRRNDDLAVGGITATMAATPSATTTTTAGQQPHIRLPIRTLRGRVVQCEASEVIGAAVDVSAANVRNALVKHKQVEGHSTVTNKESVIISSRGYYSPRDAPPKRGLVATVTRTTINQKRCFAHTSSSSSSSPSGEDIRVKEAIDKSPTALFVLDCIEFNAGTTIALEEYTRWASGVPLCSREAIRKALLLPSSSSPSSAPSSSTSLPVSPSDNISPHAASVGKLNKSTLEQEQEQEEAQEEEDHLPELQAALYVGRALLEYISINNDTFIRSSSHSSCSSRSDVLVSGGGGEGIKNIVEKQQEADESVRSSSSSSLNVETQHSDPPVVAAAVLALGKALEEMERKVAAFALRQPSALTTPLAQECSTMKIKKAENFASQQQQQQERQQQSEFPPSSPSATSPSIAPIPQRGRGIAQIASFHAHLDASIKKLEEATKQWKLYESLCGKLGSNHNIYTTTTTKGNNNNGGGGNKNRGQQHNGHKGKNNGNGGSSPYYNTAHSVLGLKGSAGGTTTDLLSAPSYHSSGLSNCYSGGNNNLTLLTSAPECSQAAFLAEASLFLDNGAAGAEGKGEKGSSFLFIDRGVGGGAQQQWRQQQQKHQLDHLDANDARTINKNALSSSSSSSIAFLQWQHKVLTEKCPLVLEDLRWIWLDALERFADLFYFCSSSEGGGKVQHTLDDDEEEEESSSLKPLPITFAKLIRLCSSVLPAPPRITLPNEIEYEQRETNDFFEFSRKSVNPSITGSSGGSGSGSVADRVDENSIDKDIVCGQLGNKRAKCLGVNTVKRAERWVVEAERDEATARLAMQRLRRVVAVLDHGYRAGDTSIPTTTTNSRKGDLERKETGHKEASYSHLASSPLTVFPTASSTFVRNFDTVGLLWPAQRERYHHNQNQNHQSHSSALSSSSSSPILTPHHHHRHCHYAEEAIEALVREHMAGYNYSNPNRRDEGEKGEEKGVGVVVNNNDSNKLGTAANNERKEEDEDRRKKKMQEIARERASKRRVTPLVACAGGSRPLFSTRMNAMRHATVTKRHAVAQQNFHSWVRVIPKNKNKIGGGDNKSFNKGSASGRGTMSVPSPFIPLSLLLATPSTCVSTQETFGTSATKSTPTDEFEKDVTSSENNMSVHPTHFIVNGDGSVASITKYNNKPCSRSSWARSSDQSRECDSEGQQKTGDNKKGVRDEDFCGENDQTKTTTMSRRILNNSARVGFISWSALLPIDWWSSPEDRCLRLLHEFCLQWEGAVQKLRDSELEEQMLFVTADSAKEKKLGEGIFDVDTVLQNSTLTTILGETAEEGIDGDGKVVCELRQSTQSTAPIPYLSERYASLSPRLKNNVVELLRLRVTRGILLATAEAAFSLESAKLGRIVLQSRLFRGRLFCMPTPLSSVEKSAVNDFNTNDGNTNDKSTTARTTNVFTSINWADINVNEFLDKLEWVVNQHALQTRDRLGAEYTNNYRTGKMGSDLSDVAVSSIKTRQLFPAAVRLAAVALGARHQWQTLANFTEEQRRLLGLDSREALETTPFAHILIEAPQNGEGKEERGLGRKDIEGGNNANSSASSVDEERTVQLYDCLCAAQTFFHLNTCAYIATAIASSFNFHKKGLQQRLDRASEELDEMEPMVGPLERAVLAMEWGEEASDTEHSRSKFFRRVEKKLTSDAKIFRLLSRETRESLKGMSNSFHHASSSASLHSSEDYFTPDTNNSDTMASENIFLSTSHPPSNNTNTSHSHQPSPLKRAKVLLQGLKEAIEATRRTADTIRSELEHAELDNGVLSPAADPKLADYGTNTTAAATMTKPTSSCDIAWRIIQSAANEVRGNSQRTNDPRQLSFLFGASSPQNSSLYLQKGQRSQQRQRSYHSKAKISSTMTTTNTNTLPSVSTYFSFWRTPLRLISDAAAYDIDAATVAALTSLRASSHWGPAVRLSALWYHPSSSDHDESQKKSDESSSSSTTVSSTTAEEGREGNGNNSFSFERGLYADTNEDFCNSNCRNKSNDFGDPTNSNREWGDEKRKGVRGAIPCSSDNSKNTNYVVLKDTRGFAPRCPTLEAVVLLSSSCFSRGCGSSKRSERPSSPTSSSLDPKAIYERLKLPKLRPSAVTPLPAMMSSSSSSSLTTSSTSYSEEKVEDSFPPWSGLSVDGQMTVASLMLHEQSYGWVPPPVVRKLKTWFTLRVIDDDAIVGTPPPSNRHPTSRSTHTSGKHIGGVAQTRGTQRGPSMPTGQTTRDRHDNDNNNNKDDEARKTNYHHHHHRKYNSNNKYNSNHNNNNNNNDDDDDDTNNNTMNNTRLSNRGPEQHNGDAYCGDNRGKKGIFDRARDERGEVKEEEQRNRQWRNENERHFRNGVREGGAFQSRKGRGRKVDGAHRHSHGHTHIHTQTITETRQSRGSGK